MNKNCLVSVIVTSYNGADNISETIDSILGQTYRNIELILVDDGSRDNTWEIIKDYEQRDSRVHTLHQENGGPSAAREAGWRIASGEYIILSDDDDIWSPYLIEDCMKLVGQYRDADAIVTSYKPFEIGGGMRYSWEEHLQEDKLGTPEMMSGHDMAVIRVDQQDKRRYCILWGVLFSRKFMEKIAAGFLEDKKKLPLHYFDDSFCNCKVYGLAKKIVVTNQVYILYRVSSGSISHKCTASLYVKQFMYASEESGEYFRSLGWIDVYEMKLLGHYLAVLRTWYMVYAYEKKGTNEREHYLLEARRLYDKHICELKKVKCRTVSEKIVYGSVLLWDKFPMLWFLLVKLIRRW